MSCSLCLYFQVHGPMRLNPHFSFFDIGKKDPSLYENSSLNEDIIKSIAKNCYLPTNRLFLDLINKSKGKLKVSYSLSGVLLEQLESYAKEAFDSFVELSRTGQVEFLCESYYHSLSFLKSKMEFKKQIKLHQSTIQDIFSYTPTTFRNTELIYSNDIASTAYDLGFRTILAEGHEKVLGWHSPNLVYSPINCDGMHLLLKNYKLSDDIAFRFSNKHFKDWPLTSLKYMNWQKSETSMKKGELIGLFMDYETFGEHQKEESGIFVFLKDWIEKTLADPYFEFITPCETHKKHKVMATLDCKNYVSWADEERDLSPWIGNPLQNALHDDIYALEKKVMKTKNPNLIHTWRKLLTSDHFYYMCSKGGSDGDVHSHFSPFPSPHEAFICYNNILSDFKQCVEVDHTT